MQVISDQIVPAASPYPRLASCRLHPTSTCTLFITLPLPRTLPVNRRTRHVESEIMCSGSRYCNSHPLRACHSKRSISRCGPCTVRYPHLPLASSPRPHRIRARRLESGYIAPGPLAPSPARGDHHDCCFLVSLLSLRPIGPHNGLFFLRWLCCLLYIISLLLL